MRAAHAADAGDPLHAGTLDLIADPHFSSSSPEQQFLEPRSASASPPPQQPPAADSHAGTQPPGSLLPSLPQPSPGASDPANQPSGSVRLQSLQQLTGPLDAQLGAQLQPCSPPPPSSQPAHGSGPPTPLQLHLQSTLGHRPDPTASPWLDVFDLVRFCSLQCTSVPAPVRWP